jgi:hypothetical protein
MIYKLCIYEIHCDALGCARTWRTAPWQPFTTNRRPDGVTFDLCEEHMAVFKRDGTIELRKGLGTTCMAGTST